MTATTLADPMFSSIFNNAVVEPYDADEVRQALINHGRKIMNENQIVCETTEEHSHDTAPSTTDTTPSTTILNPSLCESTQTNTTPPQAIQGVSGAQYAPMDTNPMTPEQQANARVATLLNMLTTTLTSLVKELQTPTQPQTDLIEAVDTALGNADWFRERIEDSITDAVDEKDFDYEIGNSVERYMRNSFDANDHYDFEAEVRARVEDEIESIIDGLVADAVEERLADLLEEKLANANITINF